MVGVVVTTSAETAAPSGEVWISPMYWSARSGYYISRSIPYGMVVPGRCHRQHRRVGGAGGRRNKLAYRFIGFQLDPRDPARVVPPRALQPGRGDRLIWPRARPETQIVTAKAVRFGETLISTPSAPTQRIGRSSGRK